MKTWTRLLFCATALTAVCATPALAAGLDEPVTFNIAPGSLDEALIAYSNQADLQVISASNAVRGKRTAGVEGASTPREALAMLLEDSGLTFVATSPSTVTVTQGEQAGGGSDAGATVEALIVTAQKREENIQDVPIAISAFSSKDLEQQKIEGGFDLLKAIPNVTFSKNNFTSYNFSIRGIGTKAVSATTDPGVAVSFNNIALLQNRLFEQEYFDVERVEVLRGPQGTLYGRNATAGVINVISAKPDLDEFKGWLKGEVGNYDSKRVSAMVNIPLIEDKLAVRVAGALTDRQGYDFNEFTDNPVNGRSLWSGRITVGFEPTETFRGNLLWERFEEDDNRSRTGKQLCHRDPGPEMVGNTSVYPITNRGETGDVLRRSLFSQGCKPGGLYDDMAFGTPNGLAMTFVYGILLTQTIEPANWPLGYVDGQPASLLLPVDPYMGQMQSRDLRTIVSPKDPRYEAKADLLQLNFDWDVTPSLTFSSQTAYNDDRVYSMQDFNRFNTGPIFRDTSTFTNFFGTQPSPFQPLAPGGQFCDPQLGCSNTMVGMDISQGEAKQFSQEFRLQSDFDGPINFSVGANYTRFDALVDYYIFYNLMTVLALSKPFQFVEQPGDLDLTFSTCGASSYFPPDGSPMVSMDDPRAWCPYIDPNPIESINGEGHNYYRSKNPYGLKSTAAFGELYWNFNESLKLTAGLRYTRDRKRFKQHPSQLLLSWASFPGGMVSKGYPQTGEINQKWGEWTGRLGLDWKPDLALTDETLLYAFYSHGYKGGGANPPSPGFATVEYTVEKFKTELGFTDQMIEGLLASGRLPFLTLTGVEYEDTFEPEFVDAFEIGAKNTLLGGALTFNVGAFYYDYKDYQVSQIRDRTAVNENFDATAWGLEFETMFSPSRDLQIIGNLGYLDTEIAEGESSIDIMNRTAGDPNYTLVKPWTQLPSNCVVPTHVAEQYLFTIRNSTNPGPYWRLCGGWYVLDGPESAPTDTVLGGPYNQANYPQLNGGAGIRTQLGGNELPNAPHWTANIGVQYGMDILTDWRATVRTDAYWQSQSWHRVYNLGEYDKLHGWYNVNLSIWFEKPDADLKIELYAKNLLDKTPITDAFLNSDDSALTTNVFVLDPRLIGLSIRKGF